MRRIALAGLLISTVLSAQNPADYVNTFIGTTNFGATHPGAVVPGGMMSVVPFNAMGSDRNLYDKDARWFSEAYEYQNCFFTGFTHGTLSGVGCPDMSSLLTMATAGDLEPDYHSYGSDYSDEESVPGYYSTVLNKYGIRAEATATTRSSVERYTFPDGKGNILINLGEGLTNESGAMVRMVSPTEIEGMKLLGTFCYCSQAVFPVYFVARVNKIPSSSGYWKKQRVMTGPEAAWDKDNGRYKIYTQYSREIAGDDIGYWFTYDSLEDGEQVELRLGISYVSIENARMNLEAETGSFDEVRKKAYDEWNSLLGRITVKGGTDNQKTVFYTALYHTLLHPNVLNDVNGEYPLMESGKTGHTSTTRYTVFSLWDTCRNLHQLMTLVYPERQIDMVRSVVDMYSEWGWLPRWELYGRETWTMEGDPAIPMIADTFLKGLTDFNIVEAYEGMIKSATTPGKDNLVRRDIDPYIERGYIPVGWFSQDASGDNSVSHALEYYMADNALANLASALGKNEDAAIFRNRSKGYVNYYDREYGCLRPRNVDGAFLSPFNPRQGENFEPVPGFHEGSAWNYTFYVPHDIPGLAKLMGGKKAFISKLAKVFDEGLYDPSNEPDIAYPYLFSRFKGEQWRTQKLVTEILNRYYTVKPDGIPGNDDTGTMSAWAVFSMMGFYPDCPGEPYYTLTTPAFDEIILNLPSGTVRIEAKNKKNGDGLIESITVDGKNTGFRVSHSQLTGAGNIIFRLNSGNQKSNR